MNVFVDGVSVYTATRTISKYDQGASFWGVGTLVIHSGEETGGYTVNPSTGLRDMLPQSAFLNKIDPHGNFEIDEISGPNGTDDVYLLVGQSAQFELAGTVNVGTENEEGNVKIIGDFEVSDTALAIVDETGVVTGIAPGTVEARSASDSSKKVIVHFLAVEIAYVDRDVMTNQWAQKKPYDPSISAIYSGPHSGDMIEWRIAGDILDDQSTSWEAEHLASGEMISGPSGTGVNFWRVADDGGNDPDEVKWLKWKPGRYAIFCEVFGERIEIDRVNVGYRSDHVLVIGQIIPTFTHDPDKPTGAAAAFWAEGVADDFVNTVLPAAAPPSFYDFMADELETVFASQQERGAEAWTAWWAGALGVPPGIVPSWFPAGWVPPPVAPISTPPASIGPATATFGGIHGPVGTMSANHHYWATLHMLNTNPDTPEVPIEIYVKRSDAPSDETSFAHIFTNQQYRISHDFQAKFLLDENGKIDQTTFEARHNRAANGPTKMKIGEIDAGDWGIVYTPPTTTLPSLPIPLPPLDIKAFPDEPSETNSHNGEVSHDSAGKEVSSFATARIGQKGRQVSYRQFGKDAPWIFSEIIFEVDDDGNVNLLGRTSTTVQWNLVVAADGAETVTVGRSAHAPPSTPGISIFNNLNLYARSEIDRFVRLNGGLLRMEGHLESFVESGSGAWPEPPIPPSVK